MREKAPFISIKFQYCLSFLCGFHKNMRSDLLQQRIGLKENLEITLLLCYN